MLTKLRTEFHRQLATDTLLVCADGRPTNADGGDLTSMGITQVLAKELRAARVAKAPPGQTLGRKFENHIRRFVQAAFDKLGHVRPGNFEFPITGKHISNFDQYAHLKKLARIAERNTELKAVLGTDYIVAPDIVISRRPESDATLNANGRIVDPTSKVRSPFRASKGGLPILHASISVKWTLRSDRAQNSRAEALNLIRNRKGRVPHIVVVTGECLPTRLASIALGTGDIDCVYHFALPELIKIVATGKWTAAKSTLGTLVDGRRLRDIADLPLDLAI